MNPADFVAVRKCVAIQSNLIKKVWGPGRGWNIYADDLLKSRLNIWKNCRTFIKSK